MFAPQQFSDIHRLIWICGIIASVGGAAGIGIGLMKWMGSIYRKGSEIVSHIDSIPSLNKEAMARSALAAEQLASVKAGVDLLQTNHMVHIGAALDKQTDLLINMDKSLGILVDRSRGRDGTR